MFGCKHEECDLMVTYGDEKNDVDCRKCGKRMKEDEPKGVIYCEFGGQEERIWRDNRK